MDHPRSQVHNSSGAGRGRFVGFVRPQSRTSAGMAGVLTQGNRLARGVAAIDGVGEVAGAHARNQSLRHPLGSSRWFAVSQLVRLHVADVPARLGYVTLLILIQPELDKQAV